MNNTTATENKNPQATTNEEILMLLRKLVEQNATKAPQTTEKSQKESHKT